MSEGRYWHEIFSHAWVATRAFLDGATLWLRISPAIIGAVIAAYRIGPTVDWTKLMRALLVIVGTYAAAFIVLYVSQWFISFPILLKERDQKISALIGETVDPIRIQPVLNDIRDAIREGHTLFGTEASQAARDEWQEATCLRLTKWLGISHPAIGHFEDAGPRTVNERSEWLNVFHEPTQRQIEVLRGIERDVMSGHIMILDSNITSSQSSQHSD